MIQREEDQFVALCLQLDVASQGDTIEAARVTLVDALELRFESTDGSEIAGRLSNEIYVTLVEVRAASFESAVRGGDVRPAAPQRVHAGSSAGEPRS